MEVRNMRSERSGREVANQFIVEGARVTINGTEYEGTMFQSYRSNIVFQAYGGPTFLDVDFWDYSVTTGKYRNQFLGENKAETQRNIDNGTYVLVDLNA